MGDYTKRNLSDQQFAEVRLTDEKILEWYTHLGLPDLVEFRIRKGTFEPDVGLEAKGLFGYTHYPKAYILVKMFNIDVKAIEADYVVGSKAQTREYGDWIDTQSASKNGCEVWNKVVDWYNKRDSSSKFEVLARFMGDKDKL